MPRSPLSCNKCLALLFTFWAGQTVIQAMFPEASADFAPFVTPFSAFLGSIIPDKIQEMQNKPSREAEALLRNGYLAAVRAIQGVIRAMAGEKEWKDDANSLRTLANVIPKSWKALPLTPDAKPSLAYLYDKKLPDLISGASGENCELPHLNATQWKEIIAELAKASNLTLSPQGLDTLAGRLEVSFIGALRDFTTESNEESAKIFRQLTVDCYSEILQTTKRTEKNSQALLTDMGDVLIRVDDIKANTERIVAMLETEPSAKNHHIFSLGSLLCSDVTPNLSIEECSLIRQEAYQLWKRGHYARAYEQYTIAANAFGIAGNTVFQIECLIASIGTLRPINAPKQLAYAARQAYRLLIELEPKKNWVLRANFLGQFGQIMFDYDLYEQAVPWVNASYILTEKILRRKIDSESQNFAPSHEIGLYARRLNYVLSDSSKVEGVKCETVAKQAAEVAKHFERLGEYKEVIKTYHSLIRREMQTLDSISFKAREYTDMALQVDVGDHEHWTLAVCKVNKGLGLFQDYNKHRSKRRQDDAVDYLLDGLGLLKDRGICLPRHITWLMKNSLSDLGLSSQDLPERRSFPILKSERDAILRRLMR